MTRQSLPLSRILGPLATLAAPVVLALLVLTLLGELRVGAAVLAGGATMALMAVVLHAYLSDAAAVAFHVRALARDSIDSPPRLAMGVHDDLLAAVAALRRAAGQKSEALEALVASTEAVLDSLPDPLFLLDEQRRVVRANSAAHHLFERDPTGRDLAAVLRVPQVLEAVGGVTAGKPARDVEFSLQVPVPRHFRARVVPLARRAADGTVAVLALLDLTTVKRMEQMRADFVANASHELRTPLATLLGFIDTLRGPARDDAEARDRFLGIMHEQALRMGRLVQDLLSLSRIELNEHTQPDERVDLGKVLKGVVDGLEMHARGRRMTLTLTVAHDLPAVIGQADELTQVFQNLVDNAIKYGGEGHSIEIAARFASALPISAGARLREGAVAVAVRDHGEGIAREHLPRLTERFFRVDNARSRKLGGTGLGLAIVKHVVNRHRGSLAIESEPGQGSTFTVYLPAHQRAASAA